MKEIVLAGGCFWGVEAYINTIEGIIATKVGYANGKVENPTYEMVCSGKTGFAETCYVTYDEGSLSLDKLLKAYWKVVDPTILNKQGHDEGMQYRTGIYYIDEKDLPTINKSRDEEQAKYKEEIVTEIMPLVNFYDAEGYHQKYLEKNPGGYCHIPKEYLKK
jgi:peptide-methionine (S)-S-oxide reductase